ncbi:SpoIVB peptidase S55 domain-containing protein [Thermomonospora umbrina]|uniref:SpoIVB peptidase S55 domain-containing protein n=1 Tax=Thermomonospora umbrina TaxID=111806 RepID=UPI001477771F|nr:SpoIVB peptidase S55 domain-containing protein [Thermomonospora umbrina]
MAAPLVVSTPVTAHADPAPAGCPAPVPVAQVGDGTTGWGLTVSKGTTPERFTVKVQGVLKDGIAPGVDMILAEADSPALDKAGSIWAGMSGSPVYTQDGRLLGAVGYGFSGTSKLAGITPAQAMYDILKKPEQARAAQASKPARLPASLQRTLVSRGLVSASAAQSGPSRLPLPLAISGLSQKRVDHLNRKLAREGAKVRMFRTGAASGRPAGAGEVVPGGNFGVLQSYGTVTWGAIGTTTAVCDGRALAFGHPYFTDFFGSPMPGGPVRLTAVTGDAVAVVPDSSYGAFKLANFGGIAGTLTQDRGAGVAARLGAGPASTPIRAKATADGTTRTGLTHVNRTVDVPDLAASQLWSSLDGARDQITAGTSLTSWKVRGVAAGKPFEFTVANRFADRSDATLEAGVDIATKLAVLADNPYTAVRFTGLELVASANGSYGQYTLRGMQVKQGGKWVPFKLDRGVRAAAGKTLTLRAVLGAYRGPVKTVEYRFQVPKKLKGKSASIAFGGGLDLSSGAMDCLTGQADGCGPRSFADLLTKVRTVPRNDALIARFSHGRGGPTFTQQKLLNHIVGGEFSFAVHVR